MREEFVVTRDRVNLPVTLLRSEGPPLLYLHGLGGLGISASLETPAVFSTAVYDQRGHGRATPLTDPAAYEVGEFVEDARAVLDELGWERAAIGGTSMGAAVALRVALKYPDRVSCLLLSAPAFGETPNSTLPMFEAMADSVERFGARKLVEELRSADAPPEVVARMEERTFHDQKALAVLLRVVGGWTPFASLEEVRDLGIPTVIVGWRSDEMHPSALAEDFAHRIPAGLTLLDSPLTVLRNREVVAREFSQLLGLET